MDLFPSSKSPAKRPSENLQSADKSAQAEAGTLVFREVPSREESDPKEIDEMDIFLAAVFAKSNKLEKSMAASFNSSVGR
jgi:hypothetical protein